MKAHRRSVLQCQIMLQLQSNTVKTITDLANLIDAERSSVSRSLSTLEQQDIVVRTNEGWQLTDTGHKEVDLVRVVIADTPKKLNAKAKEFERIASMANAFSIPPEVFIPKSMLSIALPSTNMMDVHRQSMQDLKVLNLSVAQLKPDLSSLTTLTQAHQSALIPLLDVQEHISSLWKQLLPVIDTSSFKYLLSPTNMAVASIVEDAFVISQSLRFQAALQSVQDAGQNLLARNFIDVTQAYQHLISEYVGEIGTRTQLRAAQSVQRLVLPTVTMAQYAHSVRANYDDTLPSSLIDDNSLDAYESPQLDSLLGRLNPDFITIRRGSWAALHRKDPDYLRHAGVSQRELLSQLLIHLVPYDRLPEDKKTGPQIKARARLLGLSNSEAEYADNMANAVLSQYQLLNGYTHGNKQDETICRIVLQIGEKVILFILTKYLELQDGKDE